MAEKKFLTAMSIDAQEDYQVLAANIQEARKARGYSQREMADRCLMSFATYQSIEKASLTVSFGAILAVLDMLELTADLRHVAAPQNDSVGRQLRAAKRMRK